MEYRRLGRTGLMVSAVCLGGHWKRLDTLIPGLFKKGAGWMAINENTQTDFDKNRHEVISRCIEVGINYVDACSAHEVTAYSRAVKGRRDKIYFGYSWAEKEMRQAPWRTAAKLLQGLDEGLKEAGLDYVDLWRVTMLEQSGKHTEGEVEEMMKALETAKKQGKARAIGFSSHDRDWIKFMIEYFPQVDVVCFPFFQMSKQAPSHSLFESLKKHDVGAFGIKPFGAGSLFRDDTQANTERARLALRYILHTNTVVPIPGLNSLAEVDNAVQAIKERRELDAAEQARLHQDGQRMLAKLPPTYHWLKNWQSV